MALPGHARFVIIGAGIHGLSTAWGLAERLSAKGGCGEHDVLVVDKSGIAAGASGIACGVIRNNYHQPAMRELMAHSVDLWESDPEAFSYHPVGYMQISPEPMRAQVGEIFEQQRAIGYASEFIAGGAACDAYMRNILHDWQAQGVTSVLHEKRGGYANNTAAMYGLAAKAEAAGARIATGVCVTGFKAAAGAPAVAAVETNRGTIACDQVIVAAGPWVKSLWDMLDLPRTVDVKGGGGAGDGAAPKAAPMWRYWSLQEGTLGVDPDVQKTNDGAMAPVIHVDSDAPLYSDVDGALITDAMWGVYYKPDFGFGGVQGGAMPLPVARDADEVAVDPYGPESPEFVVDDHFAHMWCSALAHCQKRFEGQIRHYKKAPSGGVGCFTPDSFPVFDTFRDNVYVIADSNHGFKMIGVGRLAADEILGTPSALLAPFRFERYAAGRLHPTSNSPFPWS